MPLSSQDRLLFPLPAPTAKIPAALWKEMLGPEPPLPAAELADHPLARAMAHAWKYSPYLKRLIRDDATRIARLLTEGPEAVVSAALAAVTSLNVDEMSTDDVMAALRHAKAAAALATALADIAALWPLEDVTGALADLAAAAANTALRAACRDVTGTTDPTGFTVLALGKLGSRELNYSSDIDLILLFDPGKLARGRRNEDPQTTAVKIAQRLVSCLSSRTAEGYVFRVDLRLRPDPDVTPLALPVQGAEAYYQSSALPWERSAFVRARPVAGDMALGGAFLADIRPFIWRRSLDYTVVRDIRDMSVHIREHFDQTEIDLYGYDVKRGRGGIREVEFFVQIHQMIHGGRDERLRLRPTLAALKALVETGKVSPKEADTLERAYRFQRAIEHRLQMVDDAQTHSIPDDEETVADFARFCGYRSERDLAAALKRHGNGVAKLYDQLVEPVASETRKVPLEAQALAGWLASRDLPPTDGVPVIEKWRSGRYRAMRSDRARALLEETLPAIAEALARTHDPRAALMRFDDFLSGLPAGVQIFSLFQSNPALLTLLAKVLTVAPPIADALRRTPELLDTLLDPGAAITLSDPTLLAESLELRLKRFDDLEGKLDEARRWVAENQFLIGVGLLERSITPENARAAYSRLADLIVPALADAAQEAFSRRHGRVPGADLIILALGRFGSANLTAGSDLDLVFLYTGEHDTPSDGPSSLTAAHYFNRLAQRVITALSAQTAAGGLYEVDTRLRPSGQQGLLAVTVESFLAYERKEAWTWEHMALTPARVVHGPEDAAARLLEGIKEVVCQPRDATKLRKDVLEMRAEMDTHRPASSPWDVKRRRGGLIDLEFIAQYLALREAAEGRLPPLGSPATILGRLTETDLLPQDVAQSLASAYDCLSAAQTVLRVGFDSPPQTADINAGMAATLSRCLGKTSLRNAEAALSKTCDAVIASWKTVFGAPRPPQREGKA
ncbi:bifunctional [glutamine synthetase] adenylyltransferase/[glutamine synthetase]-adenylyl-L-tyrosine phosphorylase [Pedomonas mirosovicensis]|uniref:bifunctional [glutamine synthetase] adenylyltransferase/[glutamine synthetase]-adenylyl-L-tyrosine phosphorylase n=1 Tax=Pedomonas mirosovicensis TaxID=2908641 RepID=UPI00216A4AB7|nr:bifunctional [glutamine synthetase] adenylyltransferase/[glutamine synthetase]-adenylyl-L-tyrosine phosphorylase [Pedomonas mirosovicensis]MCH8685198.1 bifunctional [glutamine synthetase] adenylyltransferase/[glutamine synthetase]-adenylyl-L-tyrosine phosphorylase [Pedomonas mirosovicensis]